MEEESYSINEAITEKKHEDIIINKSFDKVNKNYVAVTKIRKEALKKLKSFRYNIIVNNLIIMIVRDDIYNEVDYIVKYINNSIHEVHELDSLINDVRKSIIKLHHAMTIKCNYDLGYLLSKIFDRIELIYNEAYDEIVSYKSRTNGIRTQKKDYTEVKKENLEDINDYIYKLFLKK